MAKQHSIRGSIAGWNAREVIVDARSTVDPIRAGGLELPLCSDRLGFFAQFMV